MQGLGGHTPGNRSTFATWLLVVVVALAGVACASLDPSVESKPVRATPPATQEPAATPTATATPTPTPPPPEPTPYNGELVAMRIPALGVEAPIEAIGKVPGYDKLDVPRPRNVGWYHIYDKPGFGTSSLYSAHKDWYPDIRGPFHSLTELEAGDHVIVVMDDGREYVYEVFLQRRYETGAVPMWDLVNPHQAEDPELLRPAGEEWVTLITCGGDFVQAYDDGSGYYVHRDVVIARLVRTDPGGAVRAVEEDE